MASASVQGPHIARDQEGGEAEDVGVEPKNRGVNTPKNGWWNGTFLCFPGCSRVQMDVSKNSGTPKWMDDL